MATNDFPLFSAGSLRIPFAHASSLLLAQALADANERRVLHFPALSWPTWNDALRQLCPDVLVNGDKVTFDWQHVTSLLQRLATSPALPACETANAPAKEVPALVPPTPVLPPTVIPAQAPLRRASRGRTFRDIIQRHPRANGKSGFTVRELCATMRISAASLTQARNNPGRLSVNAVLALAELMGEPPLRVFSDFLAQAVAKKAKEDRKKGSA